MSVATLATSGTRRLAAARGAVPSNGEYAEAHAQSTAETQMRLKASGIAVAFSSSESEVLSTN